MLAIPPAVAPTLPQLFVTEPYSMPGWSCKLGHTSYLLFSALTKQSDLQGIPMPELGMEREANSASQWVSHEVWEQALLKRQLAEARL